MKLSLQLKLGQQLTMTPQLQQAIRLLQLSTLDLQQEIHQALESNPMLELDEDNDEFHARADEAAEQNTESSVSSDDFNTDRIAGSGTATESYEVSEGDTGSDYEENRWEDHIPDDLSVDSSWDDVYQTTYTTGSGAPEGEGMDFESRNSVAESLQDHLMWKLNLTPMSDPDRLIGLAIIDAIDSNGMLTISVDAIHASLMRSIDIEPEEVLAVLHRIQQFDPIGVGYRDLAECLLIQLNQYENSEATQAIKHARIIVKDHLALLGARDYAQLMRLARIKEPELREAISIIESLNPRPGSDIAPPSTTYIIPDVIVSKDSDTGRWRVELNPETAPRIRINSDYAALVRRADTSSDNNYLRDNLQEARWFIKSLQSRNETLMKVATRIVEHQKGFF